jgi:uncharacterized protein (UPF0335 family)
MTQEAIITFASIVGALVAIFGALYTIYKIARRLDDAIGIDEEGRTISQRLERVEHQLWENGGDSLADKVNEVAEDAKQTHTEVKFMKEVLLTILGQQGGNAAAPKFGLHTFKNDDK